MSFVNIKYFISGIAAENIFPFHRSIAMELSSIRVWAFCNNLDIQISILKSSDVTVFAATRHRSAHTIFQRFSRKNEISSPARLPTSAPGRKDKTLIISFSLLGAGTLMENGFSSHSNTIMCHGGFPSRVDGDCLRWSDFHQSLIAMASKVVFYGKVFLLFLAGMIWKM